MFKESDLPDSLSVTECVYYNSDLFQPDWALH